MSLPDLGAVRRLPRRLAQDSLVRNSFFLMSTTALSSLAGFVFWIVVARLFSPDDVGRATTLLSATSMLSYFALIGLNSTLIRRLPRTRDRADLVASSLLPVAIASVLVSSGYVIITPMLAPELAPVLHSVGAWAIFVLFALGAAMNLFTDSVFVAVRSAKYNFWINGVVMSAAKIGFVFAVVGGGALAIFSASGLASALAAAVSLLAILRLFGRPGRVLVRQALTDSSYSASNYLSSCLNLLPMLIIPPVVLQNFGAGVAAAYFVAFQLATLLNSVSFAVGEALFAEGSHDPRGLRSLATRSLAVMATVLVPPVLVVALAAPFILSLFGPSYAASGQSVLIILAVSSLAVALNTWASFLLKITAQLKAMIISNVVYAVAVIGGVALAAQFSLAGVALAWGVGNVASALAALLAFWRHRRLGLALQEPVVSTPTDATPTSTVAVGTETQVRV